MRLPLSKRKFKKNQDIRILRWFEKLWGVISTPRDSGKPKNQKTNGRFYHVRLLSEKRVPSEIEDGHDKMLCLSKDEVTNKITWEAHLNAWNLFLGKIQPTTEDGKLVDS